MLRIYFGSRCPDGYYRYSRRRRPRTGLSETPQEARHLRGRTSPNVCWRMHTDTKHAQCIHATMAELHIELHIAWRAHKQRAHVLERLALKLETSAKCHS